MSDTYTTFKKFPDPAEAKKLQQLLLDNNIESLFIDVSPSLGSSFGGDLLKEYEIQVKSSDFERAEQLLEESAGELLNNVPNDYYLLTFTDDELYEVIVKRDEWGGLDYRLAKLLLNKRGRPVDETLEKRLRAERMDELARPEQADAYSNGILSSYVIYSAKKTLPDGTVVNMYSKADRQRAHFRLIIGIIIMVVFFLFLISKLFKSL